MSKDQSSSASSVEVRATGPTVAVIHQAPSSTAICVLLVEDDHMLCEVSADTLNDLGYRAVRASNGRQALAELARDRDIKVLMTDFELPGMDGQQLAAEARRRRPGIGIILVSGYDDLIREGKLLRKEGFEYLAKPYGCEDLARALKRLVGSEAKPGL
jgi:DNA-binding NtrC family response regulator